LFNPYINITSHKFSSTPFHLLFIILYSSPPCGSTPVLPSYLLLRHSCTWDKTSIFWSCQRACRSPFSSSKQAILNNKQCSQNAKITFFIGVMTSRTNYSLLFMLIKWVFKKRQVFLKQNLELFLNPSLWKPKKTESHLMTYFHQR